MENWITEEEIRKKIKEKITPHDPCVFNLAQEIISKHRGSYSIDQLLDIFDYMKCLDKIVDPNPSEILPPRDTLMIGKGDCDELAVATASLIGAIGGRVRVVVLLGREISHAFCEVDMGEKGFIEKNNLPFYKRYRKTPEGWMPDDQNHEWLSFDTQFNVPGCIPTMFATKKGNIWSWNPNINPICVTFNPS